jgi:streptogramin lyase
MRLRLPSAAAFVTPVLIAGLSLLGAAFSPRAAHAQDLYVSSVGPAGQIGTDTIQVFNGTTGASKGALTLGRDFTGLTFGPDGNLYASRNGGQTAFNPVTGAVVREYNTGGGGQDLTFGPDGNLYSARFGGIVKIDRVSGASTLFTSGGNLANTRGLAFGPDGNLYVAESSFFNIQRFDGTTGAFLGNFATNIVTPYGLTFGQDGSLYVSTGSSNSVLRYNGTTGALLGTFVAAGSGGLSGARDLAFGPDGNLYVASFQTDSVLRYNGTTGAFVDVFASGGGLDQPTYLTFGPATNGAVIPEPGTVALLAAGVLPLAGGAAAARRRRNGDIGR